MRSLKNKPCREKKGKKIYKGNLLRSYHGYISILVQYSGADDFRIIWENNTKPLKMYPH